MLWKLFINGFGNSGTNLDWAARRLADAYEEFGPDVPTRLRVQPEGERSRDATADEVGVLVSTAAVLLRERRSR
jgi:hypothetical protein